MIEPTLYQQQACHRADLIRQAERHRLGQSHRQMRLFITQDLRKLHVNGGRT
jgi:hypothetical protein